MSTRTNDLASLEAHDKHEASTTQGSESIEEPPTTFPEGGSQAWRTVIGCWLIQFCSFGYTNAYGVYNDYYTRIYMKDKYTSAQISWIGSVQLMIVLSSGLLSGRAFDTGYFYHLMIGGTLLFVFCLLMLSLTQTEQYYQVFLPQGLGMGLAIGVMYIPSMAVISHYFKKHRSVILGLVASGSGFGGAIQAIMLNKLFFGPVGFRNGVRISAALNGGLLIIAILLARPRLPPKGRSEGSILQSARTYFSEPPYVFTVIGTMLTLSGLYFPFFFLQLNAVQNGISPSLAFYVITVLNGASVAGRLFFNLFVRQVGIYNVLVPSVLSCGILIFCTLAVKDVAGTMTFAVIYGFLSGAYIGLLAPMLASLAHADSEIGTRMGICFTFTGFGGLIGSPIAGALLTTSFLWWRPIVFAGSVVIGGGICFTTTRLLLVRRKGTQKV